MSAQLELDRRTIVIVVKWPFDWFHLNMRQSIKINQSTHRNIETIGLRFANDKVSRTKTGKQLVAERVQSDDRRQHIVLVLQKFA